MCDIIEPTNDQPKGETYDNHNQNLYDVPKNITIQQFIPRERENKLYQIGNINFCRICMTNYNKYCPVFTYTTTLKLKNGTTRQTVFNYLLCTIHHVEKIYPHDYSKQMFTNTKTQFRYEKLIEKRYFQSNRSSEFYKTIFENSININIKTKENSSGISSLQTLYNEIFDIDQELFLIFEKKKFSQKKQYKPVLKKSELELYVDNAQNASYNVDANYHANETQLEPNPNHTQLEQPKPNHTQCIFKNLKMENNIGIQYKSNLSTERCEYYKNGTLKIYHILRVPYVFKHITLGGTLVKNDLFEFEKYLKDEVFTKRHRKYECVKVKEIIVEMNEPSVKTIKNINIIKYTMEDYPFMVSAIIKWISCQENYYKVIYINR